MFGSQLLMAIASVALLASSVRGECVQPEQAQADFSLETLSAGTVAAICLPSADTANPASVKLGKFDALSALTMSPVIIPATYTPEGENPGADVELDCELPTSAITSVIMTQMLEFTSLTLACHDDNDEVYFSMANRIVTGPPPERKRVKITQDVSQLPRNTHVHVYNTCTYTHKHKNKHKYKNLRHKILQSQLLAS